MSKATWFYFPEDATIPIRLSPTITTVLHVWGGTMLQISEHDKFDHIILGYKDKPDDDTVAYPGWMFLSDGNLVNLLQIGTITEVIYEQ